MSASAGRQDDGSVKRAIERTFLLTLPGISVPPICAQDSPVSASERSLG